MSVDPRNSSNSRLTSLEYFIKYLAQQSGWPADQQQQHAVCSRVFYQSAGAPPPVIHPLEALPPLTPSTKRCRHAALHNQ